jgi:AraC-like DNA-binding protein
MRFERRAPSEFISRYIHQYWIMDSGDDKEPKVQEIVPDGFPELILHFGDPFDININGEWERQDRCLIAGQIRQHFSLRNTGKVAILGIKLQPSAMNEIFNLDMSLLVDRVIPLPEEQRFVWEALINDPTNMAKIDEVIAFFEEHLAAMVNAERAISEEEKALIYLVDKNGMVSISMLCETFKTTERKLERYFKSHVGLSPKFYSRILRFAHIFKLVEEHQKNWAAISHHAGFYDQAHFIKNFKEFTGEEPSKYGFSEDTMANFFLKP